MTYAFSHTAPKRSGSSPFEAAMLPSSEKESLCRSLLAEFGAESVRVRGDEIQHGCLVGDHRDQIRNPTASLNYEKLTYKCLGCGSSGGLLWLIATLRRCSTEEARRWLEEATGTGNQIMDLSELLRYFDAVYDTKSALPAPIPSYSEKSLEPWALIHPYVTDPPEEGGRGISEEAVLKFRIGYAENYQVDKHTTSERIVLPHFWKGNLVGWQTRRIVDDGTPKFLSSPEFPKDSTIYNYEPRAEVAVVTEAMFSTVRHDCPEYHFQSTFGASITDRQVRLLSKHRTVILWLDNDDAGWKATEGTWETDWRGRTTCVREGLGELLSPYCDVLVVDNPYAADPADLDHDTVLRLLGSAVPYGVWTRPERLLCHRCERTAHKGQCGRG